MAKHGKINRMDAKNKMLANERRGSSRDSSNFCQYDAGRSFLLITNNYLLDNYSRFIGKSLYVIIDTLNKVCRHSAILTWVPENLTISPLNSIGN